MKFLELRAVYRTCLVLTSLHYKLLTSYAVICSDIFVAMPAADVNFCFASISYEICILK